MSDLHDKLRVEFSRIYWKEKRDKPMSQELADAAIAIFKAQGK